MRFLLDSSAIIAMARAGRMELLQRIVGKGTITPQVRREILGREDETTAAIRPALASWIATDRRGRVAADFRRLGLHDGEISLFSIAKKDDVLVIDEKQGRALAGALGFTVVGLLGLLKAGALQGRITRADALEALHALERAGFWVSPELRGRFRDEIEGPEK